MSKQSWDKFSKRFLSGRAQGYWWGCVNKDGQWYDSSLSFDTACHWVAMNYGWGSLSKEERDQYHNNEACFIEKVCEDSVIHSSTLKKMYEAGLIH
jgi:hypothetical protein